MRVLRLVLAFALIAVASASGRAAPEIESDNIIPCNKLVSETTINRQLFPALFGDDAIQRARLKFLLACRKYGVSYFDNPESWLAVATKNELINIYRSERTHVNYLEDIFVKLNKETSEPPPIVKPRDIVQAATKLSKRLSEPQLETLHGAYVEGFSDSRMAERNGLPVSTVQGRRKAAQEEFFPVMREAIENVFSHLNLSDLAKFVGGALLFALHLKGRKLPSAQETWAADIRSAADAENKRREQEALYTARLAAAKSSRDAVCYASR